MEIKSIFDYNGRFCAELTNGKFIVYQTSMTLMLCEKVPEGLKVIKTDIVGGIMMRTEQDFKWCVEHLSEEDLM